MVDLAHLSGSESTMPPKKDVIKNELLAMIKNGEYQPGEKLPSGRELRERYGVSQTTVNAAIEWLKATRYVRGYPGSGWYVADSLPPDA